MDLINRVNKNAFRDTTYSIIKFAKANYTMDKIHENIEEVTYNFDNGIVTSTIADKTLDIKGILPTKGYVTVFEDGTIELVVENDTFCGTKKKNSTDVKINKTPSIGCTLSGHIS
ncbi:MAG: hypothetical protein ACK5HL_04165 [Bacilli bacterium]